MSCESSNDSVRVIQRTGAQQGDRPQEEIVSLVAGSAQQQVRRPEAVPETRVRVILIHVDLGTSGRRAFLEIEQAVHAHHERLAVDQLEGQPPSACVALRFVTSECAEAKSWSGEEGSEECKWGGN